MTIARLVEELKYDDRDVSQPAARELVRVGVPAVPVLITLLSHPDAAVRAKAAEVLGRIGDVRAVEPLIAALQDEDARVLIPAAEALGWIGDARANWPLVRALDDGYLQLAAAEALGRIALRAPDPQMRGVMPRLRHLSRWAPFEVQCAVYRTALRRIEEATASLKDLPLPSAAATPSLDGLPRPAVASPPESESLPVPSRASQSPTDSGQETVPALALWRRFARALNRDGRHG